MKLELSPESQLIESGAEDPVFDVLVLAGPVLVGLVALLGRSAVTVGLAAGYLLLFAGNVGYNWVR